MLKYILIYEIIKNIMLIKKINSHKLGINWIIKKYFILIWQINVIEDLTNFLFKSIRLYLN